MTTITYKIDAWTVICRPGLSGEQWKCSIYYLDVVVCEGEDIIHAPTLAEIQGIIRAESLRLDPHLLSDEYAQEVRERAEQTAKIERALWDLWSAGEVDINLD